MQWNESKSELTTKFEICCYYILYAKASHLALITIYYLLFDIYYAFEVSATIFQFRYSNDQRNVMREVTYKSKEVNSIQFK